SRAIVSTQSFHGPEVCSEHDRITLVGGYDMCDGLSPWHLFGHDKFPSFEVPSALTQHDHYLKREINVAVQILMQRVEAAGSIFQDQACWAALFGLLATLEQGAVYFRKC